MFAVSMAFAVVTKAEDVSSTSETAVPTLYVEEPEVSTSVAVVTEDLEGVDFTVVEEVPSAFGLFWLGLKERVSLTFTFDPVKKAEKQVAYAEQRMKIAEKIAESSDDPKVQEKVQKMVDRAQELMAKVEEKKDKFLENKDKNTQRLLKNVAIHTENKEALMDKIEARLQDKLTEEQMAKFQEMREEGIVKAQGILQALSNPNMPEDVKTKLQEVKDRIDAKSVEVQQFREDQKQALEDLKNGVEGAKEELKALYEARKEGVKNSIEETKARLDNRLEMELKIREEAQNNDDQAQQKLEMMKKIDEQVKEKVQERVENRQEVREENKGELRPNVTQVRPLPLPAQEQRIENRQEVRDDILNDPEKLKALMEQKIEESKRLLENSDGGSVEVDLEDSAEVKN